MSLGCYVGDVYCGCVRPMYADDLIPVSVYVNLLQRIIDTCCEEAVLKSYALKSNIIFYGPKCTDFNIELHVDSIAIPCVNQVKYLGVYLMSAKCFKVCMNLKRNFWTANITN